MNERTKYRGQKPGKMAGAKGVAKIAEHLGATVSAAPGGGHALPAKLPYSMKMMP
jgi:hypothetical protein